AGRLSFPLNGPARHTRGEPLMKEIRRQAGHYATPGKKIVARRGRTIMEPFTARPAHALENAMSSEGSVTRWVTALKGGDAAAAQPLWERYYRRLVALARNKLQAARRRVADEEDVVQGAFHSFFQGVAQGRFPRLDDRGNLWSLLVVLTA